MTVAAIYRLDKIVAGSDFTLEAIDNADVDPGIQSLVERAAGEGVPNFIASDKVAGKTSITTPQIATLLGAVGIRGLTITGNTDFYQKLATATANAARNATSHHRVRSASSIVYWTRITLPNRGRATADIVVCPVFDGSNEPYVYAGGVALITSFDVTNEAFFQCGPVKINGTTIGGIQEIVIESGAEEEPLSGDGEHHTTLRVVKTITPKVTYKTLNGLSLNDVGPAGLALNGSTGLSFWARKIARGGARVANATEEHISFIALNGRAKVTSSRGEGTNHFEETVEVEISDPASGTPLTIDTTAAIS